MVKQQKLLNATDCYWILLTTNCNKGHVSKFSLKIFISRVISVPLRRNLTGNVNAHGYRTNTERVRERKRNGYRTDTERKWNGYGRITDEKKKKEIRKIAFSGTQATRERVLFCSKLRYQSVYQGFGNDATLNTNSYNFRPARRSCENNRTNHLMLFFISFYTH